MYIFFYFSCDMRKKTVAQKVKKAYRVARAGYKISKRVLKPRNIKKAMKDYKEGKGLVLAGSRYIGPGNPLNAGEPLSKDDANAKQHDIDYDNYLKKGVKAKDLYLGYSDADKRLLDKTSATTPEGFAITAGMGAKKIINKLGLTKRIRDKDVYGGSK